MSGTDRANTNEDRQVRGLPDRRQCNRQAGKRFARQADRRQGNRQVRGLPDRQTAVNIKDRKEVC